MSNHATTLQANRWSVELFAAFWSEPRAQRDRIPSFLAPDIVGYWPGRSTPVRGAKQYWDYVCTLLEIVPDIRVRVRHYLLNDDVTSIWWEATGTDVDAQFVCEGCDRLIVRDGMVLENRIACDHPILLKVADGFARRERERRHACIAPASMFG